MTSEKSPIFIVGCAHSGTSLLLRMLGSHSRLCAIPFESNFAIKWTVPSERSEQFFIRCDNLTLRMGKARWVEKTPRHIYRMKEILHHFPKGKILISLRDGRDVACSIQDRTGSLAVGIDRWATDNQAGHDFWSHPNVCLVRYEKVVSDPESTLRDVFDFIGEKIEDPVFHYHKTTKYFFASTVEKPRTVFGENHEVYRNWQINQPLFDGRGKWLRLTEPERQLIKETAGKMLIEYGYAADLNW